ncbi:MAG: hypothetical protein U0694_08640 [Anaerolineae bacterium]
MRDGVYDVELSRESADLELWAITVDGEEASVVLLGSQAYRRGARQNYTYIMVFNPAYDDDVNDCTYQDYNLT